MTDMKQAARERRMVRQYQDQSLPQDIVEKLNARIAELNQQHPLAIRLITDDTKAVWTLMKIIAKNVKHFFLMAGDASPDLDEHLGYAGADLMLYAQTLGLNTWWIGGTYNKSVAHHADGKQVVGIVAVGYGQTQGKPHKAKTYDDVAHYDGETPQWFRDGVEMALLAPTAMNKLAFRLTGHDRNVHLDCQNGRWSGADSGLVKYHFELGAGRDNFEWE